MLVNEVNTTSGRPGSSSEDKDPGLSPHPRRELSRQQSQASFRNDRIKKKYGAPCPYKRVPVLIDYSSHHVNPNISANRDYCAPINLRRSNEATVLGARRPVSLSRLKFNHTLTDEDGSVDHNNTTINNRNEKVRRPASSSGSHPHTPSPRKLQLVDRSGGKKSDRGASVLLGCSDHEARGFHYDTDLEEDVQEAEQRAVLAIRSALLDSRKTPAALLQGQKQGQGQGQGQGQAESSYYDEIAEDVDYEGEEGPANSRNKDGDSGINGEDGGDIIFHHPPALASAHRRRGPLGGDRAPEAALGFHHYPSSRQQRRATAMDPLALRKIVPSFDKNYLRARPPPAMLLLHAQQQHAQQQHLRKPPRPSSGPPGVTEQLGALGLFAHPSSAHGGEGRGAEGGARAVLEVSVSPHQMQQMKLLQQRQEKQEQSTRRSSPGARPSTAGAPGSTSAQSQQQQQQQQQPHSRTLAHASSAGYARRVTSAASARRGQSRPASSTQQQAKQQQQQQQQEKQQQQQAGDEEVFEVGAMVQARYKDRAPWWQGRVVARNLPLGRTAAVGFKYDVRYGEVLERNVPPSRMRRRPCSSSRPASSPVGGGLALGRAEDRVQGGDTSLRDLPDVIGPEQQAPAPLPALLGSLTLKADRESAVSQPSPSSSLVAPVGESSSTAQPATDSSRPAHSALLLGGLSAISGRQGGGGLHDSGSSFKSPVLRKTAMNQKSEADLSRAEQEQEQRRAAEAAEQARLGGELAALVADSKRSISFSDLTFEKTIGRGKFASVHQVALRCRVPCAPSRSPDLLADALPLLDQSGDSAGQGMSVALAAKTPEYRNAPPLYPPASACTTTSASEGSEVAPPAPSSAQLLEVLREVRALLALDHHCIVNFHGVTLQPRLCVLLELQTCSLAEALRSAALPLPPAPLDCHQRVLIARDVTLGLQYMHQQRFAHLDIKPHNILLSASNGGYAAKLADFGTAELLAEGQVLTHPVGTSGYTAPEISMPGRYNARADVFSLAVVLWELLVHDVSGAAPPPNPFAGKDLDEAACDAHGGVRPSLERSQLPRLNDAVARAWATAPDDRLSLADLLLALSTAED